MRVFISSVRKGLEDERDALPGIIRALGHTAVRFEDFSAQNEPSREACLQGVASSDIYILLLGPRYGHRFPDTGQSPTHDEWVAATSAGKVRVVYRKLGVEFEPEQQQLSREIGNYASGVFYDTFTTTPELLTKVATKLRELESAGNELTFERISTVPSIEWRADSKGNQYRSATSSPMLEVHVVPMEHAPYSARIMRQLVDSLPSRIRQTGVIDSGSALNPSMDEDEAVVSVQAAQRGSWNTARDGEIVGIRLSKSGQVSTWATLPSDGMGSIMDPARLPSQLASMLRFIGALNIIDAGRIAIAAGVDPTSLLTVDKFDEHSSRNRSYMMSTLGQSLQIVPDESTSLAALGTAAPEISNHLARMLIEKFNSGR